MDIDGRRVELFPSDSAEAPLVVCNGMEGEGAGLWSAAKALTGADFALAAISGLDWNADLSPWPCPPAFRGGEPFAGEADRYLEQLTEKLLPRILDRLGGSPAYVALAGYSLAGLFALYAPYRTDAFSRVASASGSLWYPGFSDYAARTPWARAPERVYLSLGDREAQTRNAVMRPVEEETRRLGALYAEKGIPTALVMNPGGHFQDPLGRIARGIAWLVGESGANQ